MTTRRDSPVLPMTPRGALHRIAAPAPSTTGRRDMSTTESPLKTTGRTKTTADQAVKETLEDYTLRFAPRSYRRWTPMVVATTALGGIAYMADFSIGAGI